MKGIYYIRVTLEVFRLFVIPSALASVIDIEVAKFNTNFWIFVGFGAILDKITLLATIVADNLAMVFLLASTSNVQIDYINFRG